MANYLAIFNNNSYSDTFSYPYVDGSLAARDISINWLYNHGGGSLYALSDVSISTLADKQALQYDSVTGKWRNRDSADITTYFYTKTQVDALLDQIIGGTY